MVKSTAEEARVRYLYRSLIVRGKIRLPVAAAARLVGPDCAYHLYGEVPHDARRKPGTGTRENAKPPKGGKK